MKIRLLILMALCLSVSLGFTEETAEMKPDDPRWALVEFWSDISEKDAFKAIREPSKAEELTLQDLQHNRALIEEVGIDSSKLDRDYYASHYRKASVRIDGDWAVVYSLDENGRIDLIPEFVHRENNVWESDYGVTGLVGYADPERPVEARWFDLMAARKVKFKYFLGVIRLSRWLKKEFNWMPLKE